ncbi:MAG: bifunctional folylpolyglutamate synthase/dihydrofolate synthase [Muribaculaceae bacterium]|nr:bifunctional folylpolyglutamate synthase/dihydrofolate synthase [Muribaculaceae bacterium]
MTYDETLNYLFTRLQSFHNCGAAAYKPGLEKAFRLSEAFGNPHTRFKSIHVGGTNGKGSVSHSLASVLMEAGLKVGLYTSPHLVDFTERIRINGKPIGHGEVIRFVERFKQMGMEESDPSFFELTTIMAFDWFARKNVDVAVIEVGLGGRLDTTNIITPLLSVITNISYDHTALLGNTLQAIATEKAGIIKPGVPAVIGRRHPETDHVFTSCSTQVIFAEDIPLYDAFMVNEHTVTYNSSPWGNIESCLTGDCQQENMQTILTALNVLEKSAGFQLSAEAVLQGLRNVCRNTGLMGRWMTVSDNPRVICDTGHNPDAWKFLSQRLNRYNPQQLYLVLGFVNDKDYGTILDMLPRDAHYYFVQPSVNRAASSVTVKHTAKSLGFEGEAFPSVMEGYNAAIDDARSNMCFVEPSHQARSKDTSRLDETRNPVVFVGGSTFVVADLIAGLN